MIVIQDARVLVAISLPKVKWREAHRIVINLLSFGHL